MRKSISGAVVLLLWAFNARPCTAANVTSLAVPQSPGTEYGITLDAFLSYSIEFAFFVDYAGNKSHPNDFSNNLLNNIGEFTGTKPYIRVGGNTQDYALFNESQEVPIIGIYDTAITKDYPLQVFIGPSFFHSFHAWPDTKYIYGFNLAANGTVGRKSLKHTAKHACKALEHGRLAYWELGNEPDLYSTSAQGAKRPPDWNSSTYVSEWLSGTHAIRKVIAKHCRRLDTEKKYKYYAPSFAGTNNHLNPIVTWEDGLDRDKDIGIISSHNYIGGATQPGVTLQGTLMNHTMTVKSINAQLNESHILSTLGPNIDPSLPFILGETNSLYNEGAPALSNSFGAALWALDFALYCAANNISRVQFHQGTNYRYQSWQPIDTNITTKGTKAPYYGNIAAASFLGNKFPAIVNIPLNESTESAYATYTDGKISKALLINMQAYNTTEDYTDNYPRPVFDYQVSVPASCEGSTVGLQRLLANGSDAITGVTFDGISYNYDLDNGRPVILYNVTRGETVTVSGGVANVTVPASSAVILNFDCT